MKKAPRLGKQERTTRAQPYAYRGYCHAVNYIRPPSASAAAMGLLTIRAGEPKLVFQPTEIAQSHKGQASRSKSYIVNTVII